MSPIAFFISNFSIPVLIGVLVFWIVQQVIRRRIYGPPGPIGFPVVGYLPFVPSEQKMHLVFDKMAKTYGDVFMVQLGQTEQLVLNSGDAIRDGLRLKEFSYRPVNSLFLNVLREAGEKNLIVANGERWRYSRNIAIRGLSLFASSKASRMEPSVDKVSKWFCQKIVDANEEPIRPRQLLSQCSAAIIMSVLFGSEPEPEAPLMKSVCQTMDRFVKMGIEKSGMVEMFPALEPFYSGIKANMLDAALAYIKPIRIEMAAHHFDGTIRTVCDAFKNAVKEGSQADQNAAHMSDSEIEDIAIDLFDAGFFTVTETLEWLLLITATYPEIMKKVQEEISNEIDTDENPTVEHMKRMPYVRSVIWESLRWTSSVALGVPHSCGKDTTFRGWKISKGTQIVSNLWSANHDPVEFKDPHVFKPERFILGDRTYDHHKAEKVIPFAAGRRRCPGEHLAIHEVFLMYSYILRRFSVYRNPVVEKKDPLLGGPPSFSNYAGTHTLIFRKQVQASGEP